mmetsp:Transcript_9869/g.24394  ORF Transcript_9869/g.24394 Transcript_9869/m.24394 type:complete len:300 (-) Transcript_9869:1182-2081(-)
MVRDPQLGELLRHRHSYSVLSCVSDRAQLRHGFPRHHGEAEPALPAKELPRVSVLLHEHEGVQILVLHFDFHHLVRLLHLRKRHRQIVVRPRQIVIQHLCGVAPIHRFRLLPIFLFCFPSPWLCVSPGQHREQLGQLSGAYRVLLVVVHGLVDLFFLPLCRAGLFQQAQVREKEHQRLDVLRGLAVTAADLVDLLGILVPVRIPPLYEDEHLRLARHREVVVIQHELEEAGRQRSPPIVPGKQLEVRAHTPHADESLLHQIPEQRLLDAELVVVLDFVVGVTEGSVAANRAAVRRKPPH